VSLVRLQGSVVIVTGGAGGVGRAMCERFAREGAQVVVVDRDGPGAREVAQAIGDEAIGIGMDVTDASAVEWLVPFVEQRLGPIDAYCSNAGVAPEAGLGAGLGADEDWAESWRAHVLAHLHAARAVLPTMARRRYGYFVVTAAAAGLLTDLDSAPYAVTSHGAVALAEWLAIQYADSGVTVSCLCPPDRLMEPADIVDALLSAMAAGRFLVLPGGQSD
jgi:NAD(P)-dependent dehydrogenase (short-subunit alcohol dehydrogenase family)